MPHRFFDDPETPKNTKALEGQTPTRGNSKKIPTGSFIVFSTKENVERVGDKRKGELTGETVVINGPKKR